MEKRYVIARTDNDEIFILEDRGGDGWYLNSFCLTMTGAQQAIARLRMAEAFEELRTSFARFNLPVGSVNENTARMRDAMRTFEACLTEMQRVAQ